MSAENEDWYWEQFDVKQKGGEFDLSDTKTKELRKQDISDSKMSEYETQFIDELYNTSDGQTVIDGENQKLTREKWVKTTKDDRGAIQQGKVDYHWGLDLKRKWKDDDGSEVNKGHPEFYKILTRGDIDWHAYNKDNTYDAYRKKHGIDFTEFDHSGQTKEGVKHIRAANKEMSSSTDNAEDEKRAEPTGEYDANKITSERDADGKLQLTINNVKQKTLSEMYGKGGGRLDVGFTYTRKDEDGNDVKVTVGDKGELTNAYDPSAGPPTAVVKPKINIPNIKVKVPASLAQWKGLAKETLKVGGKKE